MRDKNTDENGENENGDGNALIIDRYLARHDKQKNDCYRSGESIT